MDNFASLREGNRQRKRTSSIPATLDRRGRLITPDLLLMKKQQVKWVEAKHKNMATFFRKKWRWQTGIDKRHYEDYLKVQDRTPAWPIWLLFLQEVPLETNAPPGLRSAQQDCLAVPSQRVFLMKAPIRQNGKRNPMVYWGLSDGTGYDGIFYPKDLKLLATLESVFAASGSIE